MGTDELHEHAPEHKRYVYDQPIFVAAELPAFWRGARIPPDPLGR
jgi:hypothetical protein